MDWFRVDSGLPDHHKLDALVDEIDWSELTVDALKELAALGLVINLWAYCARCREDGDLSRVHPRGITRACRWPGDPQAFTDAMTAAGWLDQHGDVTEVHDWDEKQPLVHHRERQRRYRKRQRDDTGASRATSPRRHGDEPARAETDRQTHRQTERETNARARAGDGGSPNPATGPPLDDELSAAWSSRYDGERPRWTAKDKQILYDLTRDAGPDEVRKRWKRYLEDAKDFYRGHPVRLFAADWDKWSDAALRERSPQADVDVEFERRRAKRLREELRKAANDESLPADLREEARAELERLEAQA